MPFPTYSNLSNALYLIGCKYNLILVDWNEEKIVDLNSKENIMSYLKEL